MTRIHFVLAALLITASSQLSFAQKEFTVQGVMMYSDLEGGCWYLQAKQEKYELTASPEILRICHVPGRMLSLRVRQAAMMASPCMIGHMVEVAEVLDTLFHPHNPPVFKKFIKGRIHRLKNGCWYVLASDKKKYELQTPIPKQFLKLGSYYHRLSNIIPASEGNCNMDNVIIISELEPDIKAAGAKQKISDPR